MSADRPESSIERDLSRRLESAAAELDETRARLAAELADAEAFVQDIADALAEEQAREDHHHALMVEVGLR